VLCHAEVASRFSEPGGPYLYVREAFGPSSASGRLADLRIRVTSMGAASRSSRTTSADPARVAQGWPRTLTLFAVAAIVATINVAGVRTGAHRRRLRGRQGAAALLLGVLGLMRFSPDVLATQRVANPTGPRPSSSRLRVRRFEAALIPPAR
jgi:amino acid transporter